MSRNKRDITFGSFNLYNLQLPAKSWRGKRYSEKEYKDKIGWSAGRLRAMDADVIAFQELWSPQCLCDVFKEAQLENSYHLAFIRDDGWYDIAVAVAVRRPWQIRGKKRHKSFPGGFRLVKRPVDRRDSNEDEDDDIRVDISEFSRAVLQLTVGHGEDSALQPIEFLAVHLKSKVETPLDQDESRDPCIAPHSKALGAALSTIRRTAESAALRIILNDVMKCTDTPVVVVGDYNDAPNSNTLAIVTEQPSFRFYADSRAGRTSDKGLYNAGALQQLRSFRDVNYTYIHKGEFGSLDHILVSEQFYDHSQKRIWSFREMRIWNDHLMEPGEQGASDHGLVCAGFDYNAR